jgi:hypothetical protein
MSTFKKNSFNLFILFVVLLSSCRTDNFEKEKYGNCTDNIQNQREEGLDCGGPCMPCSSCDDGVKNKTETGIDCGGECRSCVPDCTIPFETVTYTLLSQSSGSGYTNSQGLYGKGFFSGSSIRIDFSGGSSTGLVSMTFQFMDGFYPIPYLPVNETMVFSTVSSSFDLRKKSFVRVSYSGNYGFSGFGGALDAGQAIFMTKTNQTDVFIRFCNLKGGKDIFSLSGTAK